MLPFVCFPEDARGDCFVPGRGARVFGHFLNAEVEIMTRLAELRRYAQGSPIVPAVSLNGQRIVQRPCCGELHYHGPPDWRRGADCRHATGRATWFTAWRRRNMCG
jgi:hypothetical protein